jgi:hypothetical protein
MYIHTRHISNAAGTRDTNASFELRLTVSVAERHARTLLKKSPTKNVCHFMTMDSVILHHSTTGATCVFQGKQVERTSGGPHNEREYTTGKPYLSFVIARSNSIMLEHRRRIAPARLPSTRSYLWILAFFSLVMERALAWGGSSNSQTDDTVFGNTFVRDWLYNSKSISLKVEGCAWGYVEDSENAGCLADGSDDGTTNWYMMANCKRPQVVFSVYASSSGSTSCNSGNFVGSVSVLRLGRIAGNCKPTSSNKRLLFSSSQKVVFQSSFITCKPTMATSTTMATILTDSMRYPTVRRVTKVTSA